MLARNAESLYWIGRYVERADDTARILDVTVHQLLEDSSVDPDQASRTLLKVLGIKPPDGPLDVWSLTNLVALQQRHQGWLLDRRVDLCCTRKCPWCTGSHVHRDMGVPEHHLQRAG